jgi:recombinational DNA repair protein RecR
MNNDIPEISELIQQFSKLPGLGPKSAKRIILKLINNKDNMIKPLAKSLAQVYKKVVSCIATSATVEGQTTAHYIEDTIKENKLKITKLAQGLPVGGEIEQLDDGTLFSAFKNRVPVTSG